MKIAKNKTQSNQWFPLSVYIMERFPQKSDNFNVVAIAKMCVRYTTNCAIRIITDDIQIIRHYNIHPIKSGPCIVFSFIVN